MLWITVVISWVRHWIGIRGGYVNEKFQLTALDAFFGSILRFFFSYFLVFCQFEDSLFGTCINTQISLFTFLHINSQSGRIHMDIVVGTYN